MAKIFVDPEKDTLRISLHIDYSGTIARVIQEPDKTLYLSSPLYGGADVEREAAYRKAIEEYQKAIGSPSVKKETFVWRHWNLSLRRRIEKESETFNPQTREIIYDTDKMNDGKIRLMLVDWTLTDESGNKIPLTHENGVLSGPSFEMVKTMEPTILLSILGALNRRLYMSGDEEKNSERGLPDPKGTPPPSTGT